MELKFVGRETIDKCYDFGVRGDNNAEIVEFVVDKQQGDLDLSGFKAYVKSATPMYTFLDKQELEITQGEKEGELKLVWHLLAKHTDNELLNVQLQFEDETNEVVWQTKTVDFHFSRSVRAEQEAANTYPGVLQEQENRIKQLELRDDEIEQLIRDVAAEIPQSASEINAVPNTRRINGKELSEDITITAQDTGALSDATKYGAGIDFAVDYNNYTFSAVLKDQDGRVIGQTQAIDLPLESVVVSGEYNSANKVLILSLQNGNTIEIPIADLVNGLQEKINSQNKLNADYIQDGATNIVYTVNEREKLSGIEDGAEINTIESISINGEPLSPDNNKNIDIPSREVAWGNISGELTNQRDLKEALDFKQNTLVFDNAPTVNSQNPVTSGGVYNALESKQNAINNTELTTVDKSIVGAINEIDSVVKGKTNAKTYNTIATMVNALNRMTTTELKVGDNIYMVAGEVPDLWVCEVEQNAVEYFYTTDSDFISAITDNVATTVQVGYYKLCKLETEKVNLSADDIDDASTENKFVTQNDKDSWDNKPQYYECLAYATEDTQKNVAQAKIGDIFYFSASAKLFILYNISNNESYKYLISFVGEDETELNCKILKYSKSGNKYVLFSSLTRTLQSALSSNQLNAVNSGIDSEKVAKIASNETAINDINDKIPSGTTAQNQLVNQTDLSDYVPKSTTIAGIDLQDDVTASELRTALNVNDGAQVNVIESISVNGDTVFPDANKNIDITVPTTASEVSALSDETKYGAAIALSIDSSNYVLTVQLKDQDNNNLGTAQTIDLPLESVVVNGNYDDTTKKVVLTLQSGSTIEFSIADLVNGLQSEITAQSPLSADLVDDTDATHKFITAQEKTQIATNTSDISALQSAKQDTLTFDNSPTENSDNPVKSGGVYTALSSILGIVDNQTNIYNPISPTNIMDDVKAGDIYIYLNIIHFVYYKSPTEVSSISLYGVGNDNYKYERRHYVKTGNSWRTYITQYDLQPKLSFDTTPTANSGNPITSGGVYSALELKLPTSTKYGASIGLSINTTTYVLTAQLKDQDGNNLGAEQTIDLPLESVVVSGSYDSTNKKVILTLQNGSTIEFSVADLVSGLQSEITAQNPLSADLIDDTTATHKFVTASEKNQITTNASNITSLQSGKQDVIDSGHKLSADLVEAGSTNEVFTASEKTKLSGIETGAQANAPNTVIDANYKHITVTSSSVSDGTNTFNQYVLPNDVVQDSGYVHTDNNFTTDEKTKLAGIATAAQVNVLEGIKDSSGNDLTIGQDKKVQLSKTAVGLSDVENKSTSTIKSEFTGSIADNNTGFVTGGAVKSALDGKQDILTFDNSPTANSNNPVKSGGVYSAIQNAISNVYKFQGTKTFEELNNLIVTASMNGYVYNVSNSGMLTDGGISVTAGDNVAIIWDSANNDYVWDKLAANIDLSGYVQKSTTIAGVDLQDNITASELRTALNVADGAEVNTIESISANGTALTPDANGNVNIPAAGNNQYGLIRQFFQSISGISYFQGGIYLEGASSSGISARSSQYNEGFGGITPANLNTAVKAALTDTNHLTMSSAEQATAKSVLGISSVLTGSNAPTSSTEGMLGQTYIDTTNKIPYMCVDIENGTYTWVAIAAVSLDYSSTN